MHRLIRTDGSKGPVMSNTHIQLNKQYDKVCDKIRVLEDDLDMLLEDAESETRNNWVRIISSDLSKEYKLQTVIQDKLHELLSPL